MYGHLVFTYQSTPSRHHSLAAQAASIAHTFKQACIKLRNVSWKGRAGHSGSCLAVPQPSCFFTTYTTSEKLHWRGVYAQDPQVSFSSEEGFRILLPASLPSHRRFRRR